jgi:hypothetical protein
MRTRVFSKIIAVVVMGCIWAAIWWQIELVRHAHSKEAFLASQGRRFEMFYPRFTASFVAADIVSSIIWIGVMIAVYESLALGIYKLICIIKPDSNAPKAAAAG